MSTQAAAIKVLGFLGQIVLAWYLFPGDLALVAMAGTVLVFASLLQKGGVQQVLVHRQARLRLWATDAFWMSMVLGFAAAALMLAAAPIAAWAFEQPRLVALMAVMAAALPLDAARIVPMAKLQSALRFRAIGSISFLEAALQIVLMIVLATRGFGPYSVVLPRIIVGALALTAYWRLSGATLRGRPRPSRWRFLFTDSIYVLGALLCYAIAAQGAYVLMGIQGRTDEVGRYWWAYNLSIQTVMLLAVQLDPVLFASLSRLQADPTRHAAAFLRSMRVLSLAIVPLSVLQAVLAEPVVKLLFHERWHDAIPLLQILSVGMAFVGVSMPTGSLMQSQGRFRAYFLAALANVTIFLSLLAIANLDGRAVAIALATALYFVIAMIVNATAALLPGHVAPWRLAGTMGGTFVATAVAAGAAIAAQRLVPGVSIQDLLLRAGLGAVAFGATFLVAARLLQPGAVRDALEVGKSILPR